MSTHPVVIEAGPGAIRRLCCDAGVLTDTEVRAAALDAIDDPVALVAERPVAVAALWSATLRRLACDHGHGMVVVHPSWWPVARVGVVTRAAGRWLRVTSWCGRGRGCSPEPPLRSPLRSPRKPSWWRSRTGWWLSSTPT
ncbi:hypothetical protein I547_1359 [Mycobacterium kansasii 824]|nr:hypothetical protein I547_1359 [Mycobacterium kansasii 824]